MTDSTEGPSEQFDRSMDELFSAPVDARPKSRSALLWAGVVALLAASLFAVANLAASKGSGTPEDAINRLFTAVSNEDLLGVMGAVAPSEREVIKDDLIAMLGDLKRLDVLSSNYDNSKISGINLDFKDLVMSSKAVGEGVTAVTITGGKFAGSLTPSKLPLGPRLREAFGEDLPTDTTSDSEDISAGDPLELVTIKEDGDWYVSLAYSAAESARKDAGRPAPKFGDSPISPKGESTPEKAVEALIRAGASLDMDKVFALMPPGEGRVLRDYSPLFRDDVLSWAKSTKAKVQIDITQLKVSSAKAGAIAVVKVESLAGSVKVEGKTTRFTLDGDCYSVTEDGGETQKQCASDTQKKLALPSIPGVTQGGATQVVAVQEGGEWFVSPVRTAIHPLRLALDNLDKASLDDLIKYFTNAMSGGLFGQTYTAGSSGSIVGSVPSDASPTQDSASSTCDGAVAGYSEADFAQMSPEEQQQAYESYYQHCE